MASSDPASLGNRRNATKFSDLSVRDVRDVRVVRVGLRRVVAAFVQTLIQRTLMGPAIEGMQAQDTPTEHSKLVHIATSA